jgi:regulator of replication initiation timing
LHSQEEDFKLQHKTLMDEISYLMKENEKLVKDLEISSQKADSDSSEVIIQLKAENSALKKVLNDNESSETKENMPDELKG